MALGLSDEQKLTGSRGDGECEPEACEKTTSDSQQIPGEVLMRA